MCLCAAFVPIGSGFAQSGRTSGANGNGGAGGNSGNANNAATNTNIVGAAAGGK